MLYIDGQHLHVLDDTHVRLPAAVPHSECACDTFDLWVRQILIKHRLISL